MVLTRPLSNLGKDLARMLNEDAIAANLGRNDEPSTLDAEIMAELIHLSRPEQLDVAQKYLSLGLWLISLPEPQPSSSPGGERYSPQLN